jgi:anaerobic selenocysteine-containing dehydrogenase
MTAATRQVQTFCAMCISRCGVIASVEDGRLTRVVADDAHPNGCICVKGTGAPEIVYSPDRLQSPMLRTRPKGDADPGWQRVSWDHALDVVATRLRDIRAAHGAESVVFGYATSRGSATSDFNLWVQRLANAYGSPNLINHLHLCNWHREYGSTYTYGTRFPYPDYDNSRCILLWGFNPEASWAAAAARIARARARGARLIVIDPRRSTLAGKADAWLRVRPGGDGPLAMAMIHVLLDERLYDAAFVRRWTNAPFLVRRDTGQLLTAVDVGDARSAAAAYAWDEAGELVAVRADGGLARDAAVPALSGSSAVMLADGSAVECRPALDVLAEQAARYAPELVEDATWVPASEVRRAARMFAVETPSCYFTWVGLEQDSNAMQVNRATSVFYALTGQFDRRGSNVLFATVPTAAIAGQELLPPGQAGKRLGRAERPLGPPGFPGLVQAYNLYRGILDGEPYRVRGLVTFGSDHLLANGDPLRGRAALQALDFYVHMDMFANPSAELADVLLPAASCWERAGLMAAFDVAEDTSRWVQLREPVVPPCHDARPELDVIFELATRLGLGPQFFDGNVEAALDHQLAPTGLTAAQLRQRAMGAPVDVETRHEKHAEIDGNTGQPRGFATPSRRIEIYASTFARAGHPAVPLGEPPPPDAAERDYPLLLTFFRVVQFCDESHRNIPRLRRRVREPCVEIHPTTASALNVHDGDWVVIESPHGRIRMKAQCNAHLHPGVVCTQYGWWQACVELGLPGYDPFSPTGANANLLIANHTLDPISGSVGHRATRCRIRKE